MMFALNHWDPDLQREWRPHGRHFRCFCPVCAEDGGRGLFIPVRDRYRLIARADALFLGEQLFWWEHDRIGRAAGFTVWPWSRDPTPPDRWPYRIAAALSELHPYRRLDAWEWQRAQDYRVRMEALGHKPAPGRSPIAPLPPRAGSRPA